MSKITAGISNQSPEAPNLNYVVIYPKPDGWYYKDETGSEYKFETNLIRTFNTETIGNQREDLGIIDVPNDTLMLMEHRLLAVHMGGSGGEVDDAAAWRHTIRVKKKSGVLTLSRIQQTDFTDKDDPLWGVYYDVIDGALRVRVQGVASTQIKWKGTIKIFMLPF